MELINWLGRRDIQSLLDFDWKQKWSVMIPYSARNFFTIQRREMGLPYHVATYNWLKYHWSQCMEPDDSCLRGPPKILTVLRERLCVNGELVIMAGKWLTQFTCDAMRDAEIHNSKIFPNVGSTLLTKLHK